MPKIKTKSATRPAPKPQKARPQRNRGAGNGVGGAAVARSEKKPAAVAAGDQNQLTHLPFSALVESPLNPRRAFDEAALDELAQSIATDGVLQNLVARPDAFDLGRYEVINGARRLRAVKLLVERGQLSADTPLPVRVRPCSDLELLRLATVENIQRAELHPLEEGEAFALLVDAGDTTEAIARLVGKTQRWVQKRIALVERLAPKAQEALRENKITLAAAQALILAPAERQEEALDEVIDGDWGYKTADEIKQSLTRDMIPVAVAIFDRNLYTGEIVEEEEGGEEPLFADTGEAERLQRAAIEAKAEELKRDWAWVEVLYASDRRFFSSFEYGKSRDRKLAGAVIEVDAALGVEIHTGLVKNTGGARGRAKSKGKGGRDEIDPVAAVLTQPLLIAAKNRKTLALQTAVAGDADLAMAMVTLALMGGHDAIHMRADPHRPEDVVRAPAVVEIAKALAPSFGGEVLADLDDRPSTFGLMTLDGLIETEDDPEESALRTILAMTPAARQLLFSALVAERCGSFAGFRANLGDTGAARVLAERAGLADAGGLDENFLSRCRKGRLVAIARRLGVDRPGRLAGAQLKSAILARIEEDAGARAYVPPELKFGDDETLKAALTAELGEANLNAAELASAPDAAETPIAEAAE